MPNHHIVDGGAAEKGYETAQYGYEKNTTTTEEPFVHGAGTVAEATGRGGDTHRGLKSRHIQFLYVVSLEGLLSEVTNICAVP
jgi:amino acid transporter